MQLLNKVTCQTAKSRAQNEHTVDVTGVMVACVLCLSAVPLSILPTVVRFVGLASQRARTQAAVTAKFSSLSASAAVLRQHSLATVRLQTSVATVLGKC